MLNSAFSFAIFLALTLCAEQLSGQGMVPLSDVIDHDQKAQGSSDSNEATQDKPLSPEKIKAHMKIAESHLSSSSSKISIEDKPLELQSPEKHMAEEFVLNFLLKQYPKSENVEDKVEILQNIKNFAHKFENGRDLFKSTTALDQILLPALNSSHVEIRKSACGVFAIAAQNNKEVQSIAAEAGVVRRLVHLIAFDFDQSVRSKALFALTAVVRNFPKGQNKFIKDGGIPALVKVALDSETRKRALNFVTDLLQERNYCRMEKENGHTGASGDDADADFDLDMCDETNLLEKALKENGWCDVLSDSVKNIPGFDTEDQIMISEAVGSTLSFCGESVAPYSHIFHHLLDKFAEDEEFQSEFNVLKDIIRIIDPLSLYNKDEL